MTASSRATTTTTTRAARRTQAERVAASDRALLRAAVDLIAERGWERTTLAAIGDTAGYSRGLVTQRFGSKEGLLWAVIGRMRGDWSADTLRPRIGEQVGIDALRTLLAVYLDTVERAPNSIRAYYALLMQANGSQPALRAKVAELHRAERESIAGWLAAGQAAGTVRTDVDVRAEAAVFLGVLRGVTVQWLVDPDGVDLVAALTEYGSTLDRTLGGSR